jgi:hypothetical protein
MNLCRETKWIRRVLLHPDDFTIAEQDGQRHRLLEDLRREGLLDITTQSVLEGPEALSEGWARPIIWGYHEGFLGLFDAAAEIGTIVDYSNCGGEGY